MSLDTSRWRSASNYEFIEGLVAPDLAWEWLRRNPEYERDYAELKSPEADPARVTELIRTQWGLRFPCGPSPKRH